MGLPQTVGTMRQIDATARLLTRLAISVSKSSEKITKTSEAFVDLGFRFQTFLISWRHECCRHYLEGHGDLVSRVVIGVTGVIIWLMGVINLLSKSPCPSKYSAGKDEAAQTFPARISGAAASVANSALALGGSAWCDSRAQCSIVGRMCLAHLETL